MTADERAAAVGNLTSRAWPAKRSRFGAKDS